MGKVVEATDKAEDRECLLHFFTAAFLPWCERGVRPI